MPAYSFKERFVPMILDGTKTQTIRKKRKGQAKPGSTLYLYFGMRTKWCRKIKVVTCRDVKEIIISNEGHVYVGGKLLDYEAKIKLAYDDGFRPDDVSASWMTMFRWWQLTHDLPFKGDIIYW